MIATITLLTFAKNSKPYSNPDKTMTSSGKVSKTIVMSTQKPLSLSVRSVTYKSKTVNKQGRPSNNLSSLSQTTILKINSYTLKLPWSVLTKAVWIVTSTKTTDTLTTMISSSVSKTASVFKTKRINL